MTERIYKVIITEDSVPAEPTPQPDNESLAKQMERAKDEKPDSPPQTPIS